MVSCALTYQYSDIVGQYSVVLALHCFNQHGSQKWVFYSSVKHMPASNLHQVLLSFVISLHVFPISSYIVITFQMPIQEVFSMHKEVS